MSRFINATAAGLTAALLLSGCGGSSSTESSPSASAVESATASALPTPAATAAESTAPQANTGIPTKGLVNNGRGEYLQTTVAPDDPALVFDPSIADEAALASFTPEEITEALRVAVTFTAEETFDSTANGGSDADKEAWWQANESKFHPIQSQQVHDSFMSDPEGQGLVLVGRWREGRYDFAYGADRARITERTMKPSYVKGMTSPDGQPYLGINVDASVQSVFLVDGKEMNEDSSGYASYGLLKDTDGSWKIVGYKNQFTTIPIG